jgi:hypothetical protein
LLSSTSEFPKEEKTKTVKAKSVKKQSDKKSDKKADKETSKTKAKAKKR